MRKLFYCILMVCTMPAIAQSVYNGLDIYDSMFLQSVKSCDEFMCRFNEEEYFPDMDKEDPQLGQKNFLFLFDYQLSEKREKDAFLKDIFQFYDTVKSNKTILKYESKQWFAEVCISFLCKKKPVELSLILQPENTSKDLPCWTIVGVNGLEKIGYADSTGRMVISPEQHEAEFMEFESIFNFSSRQISQFRSYNTQLDALSYFFALVESGTLTFNKRVSTIFHFFDVPSYVFSVKYYNRKKANTGWLISGYKKVTQEEKSDILKKLLSK